MKLMQRLTALLLAAIMLFGCLPTQFVHVLATEELVAETCETGNHNYVDGFCSDCGCFADGVFSTGPRWTLKPNGIFTVSGNGYIPSKFDGADESWLYYEKSVEELIIEDGVTSIGYGAFSSCSNLRTVTVADSVTYIESSFDGCTKLTDVTIHGALTDLKGGFEGCTALKNVTLNGSIQQIWESSFEGCTSLESITLPEGTKWVGDRTFYGCTSLESITVPSSVLCFGSDAFKNCNNLSRVNISDLAAWCAIDFDHEQTACPLNAGASLYMDGEIVTDLVIPEGVTEVYDMAFYGCSGIESITFPSSLFQIRTAAFMNCTDLNTVTFLGDAPYMSSAFNGVTLTAYHPDNETWTAEKKKASGGTVTWVAYDPCEEGHSFEDGVCSICGALDAIDYGTCGDNATWVLDGTYTLTISGTGAMANYNNMTSPEYANPAPWSAHKDSIKTLIVEDGITELGSYAFYQCAALTEVSLPETITTLNSSVFQGCSSLEEIALPASLQQTDTRAFDCAALTAIHISDLAAYCAIETSGAWEASPWYYGANLYMNGEKISDLVISDDITLINSAVFYGCASLESITIPTSVTTIRDWAFANCANLETVTFLGDAPRYMYDDIFLDTTLTVYYPAGNDTWTEELMSSMEGNITWVAYDPCENGHSYEDGTCTVCGASQYIASGDCGDNATWTLDNDYTLTISGSGPIDSYDYFYAPWYEHHAQIKEIIVEDGITSISDGAFYACDEAIRVTIGDDVTSIGNDAFYLCKKLATVSIGSSVTSIGVNAFYKCTSLSAITIPGNVTSIGDTAFNGCTSLANVTIADGVTSIGSSAFYECTALTSISIPDSVTAIGDSAFYDCGNLTSAVIGSGVTTLEASVFARCSKLSSVTLPEGLTSIGAYAFNDCALTSVTIPKGVTSIGEGAFNACGKITDVYYAGNKAAWDSITFGEYNSCLLNARIHYAYLCAGGHNYVDDVCTVCGGSDFLANGTCGENATWKLTGKGTLTISGTGAIADYNTTSAPAPWSDHKASIKKLVVEEGITDLGAWAFYNCAALAEVSLPESLTETGEGTFYGCSALTAITIPSGITKIGSQFLDSCSGLTEIVIPANVTEIDNFAFQECTNLASVSFPEGLTRIGQHAFENCDALTTLDFPDTVRTIDYGAFMDCDGLTELILPAACTGPSTNAFYSCSNLTSVTLGSGCTTLANDVFGGTKITTLILPENVDYWGSGAFQYCNSLTELICLGNAPTRVFPTNFFRSSANITIRYPALNATWPAFISSYTSSLTPSNGSLTWEAYYPDPQAQGSCGDTLTWVLTADGVLTISGTGVMYDYATGGAPWYAYADMITTINLPSGLSSIGAYAFEGCSQVTSITIPTSVGSIGTYAFSGCSGFTNLVVPSSVTSIGIAAFSGCAGLKEITLPFIGAQKYPGTATKYPFGYVFGTDSYEGAAAARQTYDNYTTVYFVPRDLTVINVTGGTLYGGAFSNCEKIVTINLRDGIENIQSGVFSGCINLTNVNITSGLTSIGSSVFQNCESLQSVVIGDSVTSIGSYAFENCSSLTSVSLPETVTYIGSYAFRGCSALESIVLPDGLTSLSYEIFVNCTSLAYVELPDKLTSISWGVFSNCSSLESIELPDTLTSMDSGVFGNCTALKEITIPRGMHTIPYGTFAGCTSLTSVTLPDTIVEIASSAFSNCTALVSIELPAYMTTLGSSVFSGCSALTSIEVPADVKKINNSTFSGCTSLESAILGDSVTLIGYHAFRNCNNLETVTFGSKLETIENEAFYHCSKLKEVILPDTVLTIGESAFNNCSGLETVTLGSNLTTLGSYAFYFCSNLAEVELPASITSIDIYAFGGCSALTSMVIPEGITTLANSIFSGCTNLQSVELPESLTSIDYGAFYNCTSLASINLPENLTSIGSGTFYCCSSLASIDLPDSITTIGSGAFQACSGLTEVTLPAELTTVSNSLFYSCKALEKVTLGNKVTSIGDYAFEYNSSLNTINFPEGITSIGERAFYECDNLSELTFPTTLTTIGDYAFRYVHLAEVKFPGNPPVIGTNAFTYGFTGYYPHDNANWTEEFFQNYSFITWKPYCFGGHTYVDGVCTYCGDIEVLDQGACGANMNWKYLANGNLIISGKGAMDDFEPGNAPWAAYADSINTVVFKEGITSIGSYAFKDCANLTSVDLPTALKSIGDYAFSGCTSLASIDLGSDYNSQLKTIGAYAFEGCKFTYVDIPSSVTQVGEGAFKNCQDLSSISLNYNLSAIEDYTFYGCAKLSSISTTSNLRTIGDFAFYGCAALYEFSLYYITHVGESAFENCTSLTSFTCQSLVSIGDRAFYNAGYNYVNLGETLTSLGEYAFAGCQKLYTVTIDSHLDAIPKYTFQNCPTLNDVTLRAEEITTISEGAFKACSNLATFYTTVPVSTVEADAFNGCTKLKAFDLSGATTIGENAFMNCAALTGVTLTEGLTILNTNVFNGCDSLTEVNIPTSVTAIDSNAFSSCANDNTLILHFASDAPSFAEDCFTGTTVLAHYPHPNATWDDARQNYGGTVTWEPFCIGEHTYVNGYCSICGDIQTLGSGVCGENLTWVFLADGSLTISGSGAMYNFESGKAPWAQFAGTITSVVMDDAITTIGNNAFWSCTALTSVNVPSNLISIGDYAFIACISLPSIKLGTAYRTLTTIGTSAFEDCRSLTYVEIPRYVAKIGTGAFSLCTGLEDFSLYSNSALTSIANSTFAGCTSLKSFTWNSSYVITSIGDRAFEGCTSLRAIGLPYTVTSIGDRAFADCTSLTGISLNTNLQTIGDRAFANCTSLTAITIPESVTQIGEQILTGCGNLTNLTIPFVGDTNSTEDYEGTEQVRYPLGYLFGTDYYANSTSVTQRYYDGDYTTGTFYIPENLEYVYLTGGRICYGAFSNLTNLQNVSVAHGIQVDSYAFSGCTNLQNISLMGITEIGDSAFRDCTALRQASFDEQFKSFGENAFYGCTSLQSVSMPHGLTTIGANAFYNCSNLYYDIPETITYIGDYAFYNTAGQDTLTLSKNLTYLGVGAFSNSKDLCKLIVNASLDEIPVSAFSGCSNLYTVTLNGEVATIGANAFNGCSNLYYFNTAAPVSTVKTNAFNGCTNLQSFDLSGATTIGDGAFKNCRSLASVSLAEGLTVLNTEVFNGCACLIDVTIPSTVTAIKETAFGNCAKGSNLTLRFVGDAPSFAGNCFDGTQVIAYYPGTNETWTEDVRQNYGGTVTWKPVLKGTCGENLNWILTEEGTLTISGTGAMDNYYTVEELPWYEFRDSILTLQVGSGVTNIGTTAFYGCINLSSVTLPSSVTRIENNAFHHCDALKTIDLGSVTYIGNYAFNSSGLTNITIPDSVTGMGENVFNFCSDLRTVTLGSGLTRIANGMFKSCSALESIILPENITAIGTQAFSGCSKLSSVEFKGNVTSIGDYAFQSCTALAGIPLPESLQTIGLEAFYGCIALTELTIPANVSRIGNNAFTRTGLTAITFKGNAPELAETAFSGITATAYYPSEDNTWNEETLVNYGGTITWQIYCVGDHIYEDGYCTVCGEIAPIATGSCGIAMNWLLTVDGQLTITGTGTMTNFAQGGAPWYEYADQITSLKLESGIATIGDYAFYGCRLLTEVDIPASVLDLGDYAFYSCNGLTNVTMHSGMQVVGSYAFGNCFSLTTIVIPATVHTMGEAVLNGCRALTEITLPFIGNKKNATNFDTHYPLGYTFGGRFTGGAATEQTYSDGDGPATSTYYIPRTLTTVNVTGGTLYYGAFYNCNTITTVNLRDNVENVKSSVFTGCTKLTTVNITSGLTAISSELFADCKSLQTVTISESVTTIGSYAFQNCISLESIQLPANLTTIGYSAFSGCTGLTSIKIPRKVTEICDRTFDGCSALASVELPALLTTIGSYAFTGCSALKQLEIPYSVTTLGSNVFGGAGLVEIEIPEGVMTIPSALFYNCADLVSVTIPDSVDKIEQHAFYNCRSLAEINLPEWLYSLGQSAFDGCSSLERVVLPEFVETINSYTFSHCTNLKEVVMGEYVETINPYAFQDCASLTSINLPESLTYLGNDAFSGCSALTAIDLPDGLTAINSYTFANCASLTEVHLPEGLKTIGDRAFESCHALAQIDLPASLTTIGYAAFNGCRGLTQIEIPSKVTQVASSLFNSCTNLTHVKLPAGVTSIGNDAFRYCENLESIVIPNSVTSIGTYAFGSCHKLADVTLSDSLTAISSYLFQDCYALSEIVIPASVTSLPWNAFEQCDSLADVIFLGNAPQMNNSWHVLSTVAYYPAGNATWTEDILHGYGCSVALWLPLSIHNKPFITVDADEYGRPVLTWDAMEGAASYHIYRHVITPENAGESGNTFEMVCNTAETTYIDTNITPGYTGQYRVVAVDENGGCSFLSNQVDKTWILPAPTDVSAKLENQGIQVSWTAVPYAECYNVYRAESPDGPWSLVRSENSKCSYNDYNGTIGTTYYYKVTACARNEYWEECGHSDFSFSNPILKRLGIPSGIRTGSGVLAESYKSYIQVSWHSMGETTGYEVYRADTENGKYTLLKTITNVSNTDYYDTDVTPGKEYFYKIKALHENPKLNADESAPVRGVCKLSYVQIHTGDVDKDGYPIISWDPVEGAIRYELLYLYIDGESSKFLLDSTTGTSFTITDDRYLDTDEYALYIRAVAEIAEASSESGGHYFHKHPAQPVVSVSYDEEGRIVLTWDATEGSEAYNIYYSFTEDGGYFHTDSTTETSYVYQGEGQGKTIYFKVTGNNNWGSSKFSEVKSATWKLGTPTIWEASADGTGIRLAWSEMFETENYIIYRSTSKTSGYQQIGQTFYCSYQDNTVKPGCTYYYKVQATNANPDAASGLSNAVSCTSALASPKPTLTYDEATGYPVLSWEAVVGATAYVLYENDSPIKTTTETSVTIEEFTNGDYFYYLVATGENGNRSEPSDHFWPQSRLAQPVVTASKTASSGFVKLKWNAVAYSDAYIVYRATSKDGEYKAIGETSGESATSYTDSSAKVGTTYYYKVMAYSDGWGVPSAMSEAVSAHRDLPQPKISVSNTESSGKVKVSWSNIEGAEEYAIYRKVSGGEYSKIGETSKNYYTDSTGKVGTKYYYRIKAIHSNSSANSAYSDSKSATRDLMQPEIKLSNTASSGKCKLTWEEVDGAKEYSVYRKVSGGEYEKIGSTTKEYYTDSTGKVGTKYYYRIKAIHSNSSANSAYSDSVSGTRDLAQPDVSISNTASSGKCKLSWDKVSSASKYYIYRATSKSGSYEKIGSTTSTSYTDSDAKVGKKYYYKVKAIYSDNTSANSAYSDIISGTRDLARPDVSVKLSSGKPKLSWSKISKASKYYIYRATSENGTYEKIGSTTSTSYTDKTAKKGKTYYYKVTAIYSDNTSANSAYSSVDKIKVK